MSIEEELLELDNWNPMEDDFNSKTFNSYDDSYSLSPEYDDCCLYVRHIPPELSRDAFATIMSQNGKKIQRVYLNCPKQGANQLPHVYGFVAYATHRDAQEVMNNMNGKPPYNFKIGYAKRKDSKNNSLPEGVTASQVSHLGGAGRGIARFINQKKTPNGECDKAKIGLKIFVDGDRRVSFLKDPDSSPEKMYKENVSSASIQSPDFRCEKMNNSVPVLAPVKRQGFNTENKSSSTPLPVSQKSPNSITQKMQNPASISSIVKYHQESKQSSEGKRQQNDFNSNKPVDYISHRPALIQNPFLLCLYCNSVGKLSCSVCKKPYCSATCQEQDWERHKLICHCLPVPSKEIEKATHVKSVDTNDSSYVSDGSSSECERSVPSIKEVFRNEIKSLVYEEKNRFNANQQSSFEGTSMQSAELKVQKKDLCAPQIKPYSPLVLPCIKYEEIGYISLAKIEKVSVSFICSPSRFWIQTENAIQDLSRMENEIESRILKPCHDVHENCVYCCVYKGKIYRAKTVEVKKNGQSVVHFFDYGNTATVPKTNLFTLPQTIIQYPAQAVCCKLVDGKKNEKTDWSEDEIASFKLHTEGKFLKAHIFKQSKEICEISLLNEDDITLYSILIGENDAMSCLNMLNSELESKSSLTEIPSVWSQLQEGSRISLVIMDAKDENILALLKIAGFDPVQEINELDNLMKSINTESINMCVEEGDMCAAFSPNYKQYYRCIVLKRMKNSFLVQYIDYGNEEEVTELRSLPPDLFKKCTYIVCLKKPNSLSDSDFVMYFSKEHELLVRSVNKDVIEMSFSCGGEHHSMLCFPWYHIVDSVRESVNISNSEDNSARRNINPSEHPPRNKSDVQEKVVKCSESPLNISSKESPKGVQVKSPLSTVGPLKNTSIPKEVEENRTLQCTKSPHSVSRIKNLPEKSVSAGCRYEVKIVWINTASELFVQLVSDDDAITALTKELNEYCSSVKMSKYLPQKGEIVCCKFAQDGNWYRGVVKNKNGDKFLVFFVDFGNEDLIPDFDIYPLPQKFACPKFSICVSLHEIKNKDLTRQLLTKLLNECWDMEVINADTIPINVMVYQEDRSLTDFICIKTSGKDRSSLQFRKLYPKVSEVVICHADEEKVYVQLVSDLESIQELSEKLNSISKSSISNKPGVNKIYCGLFTDGLWYRVCVEEVLESGICKVNFIDYGNSEEVSFNDLRELPDELLAYPVYCIPVILKDFAQHTLKMDVPYLVEKIGEKENIPEIKIPTSKPIKFPHIFSFEKQCLKDGVNVVAFCHIEKDVYYCHLVSDFERLKLMSEKLQDVSECKRISFTPSVGSVVCAKSVDGAWYRASISQVNIGKDIHKVTFIDFGNTEVVDQENMRHICDEMCKYPIFCIPLKIKDLKGLSHSWILSNVTSVKAVGILDKLQLVEIVPVPSNLSKVSVLQTVPASLNLPKVSTLQKHVLARDNSSNITVCSMESDSMCYVQLASDQGKIQELTSKLENAIEFEDISQNLEVGDVVCAKCSDSFWYRASIQEISKHEKTSKVFFLDYGNSETVSLNEIKVLPTELASYPIFSIPVQFRDMTAVIENLTANISTFPVVVVEESEQNIQIVDVYSRDKYPQILFSSLNKDHLSSEGTCEVIFQNFDGEFHYFKKSCMLKKHDEMNLLIQNSTKENVHLVPSIDEVLLVKCKDNTWQRGCVIDVNSVIGVFKVYLIDLGFTEDIMLSDMCYLPKECTVYPAFSIKIVLENTDSLKNPLCFGKQYILELSCKTKGPVPVVTVFQPYMLTSLKRRKLPIHVPQKVTFSHIDKDLAFLQDSSDCELILEVQKELQKSSARKTVTHKLIIGEIVCAKSGITNEWYRGCVEEIISEDTYKIFFVDFGKREVVLKENLECFLDIYAAYPTLCIPVNVLDKMSISKPLELKKIYSVLAENEPNCDVQDIHLITSSEEKTEKIEKEPLTSAPNLACIKNAECSVQNDEKFLFSECRFAEFSIGEQEVAIYTIGDCNAIFCSPYNIQNLTASSELITAITDFCHNLSCSSYNGNHLPKDDEMVIANFQDNLWYRAVVIDSTSHPYYEVFFVDYGNSELLHLDRLRKMEKQFMSLEVQAHLCSLKGFIVPDENRSKVIEELKAFLIFSLQEPLNASVKFNEGMYEIHIPSAGKLFLFPVDFGLTVNTVPCIRLANWKLTVIL
ncbi:uncharacterized protein LOC118205810 isoform X3 [Stegodyphus dumicola]|uniref:uncharacterized protein LOC118205810 isoform X3 n=1 Tax=Stegodyphus dumicola TaxID=202533 RepID=UPI0015AAF755|nr:uncharacterized protein LOC118205810 isoform X3 [Stegodyphus dumicola]